MVCDTIINKHRVFYPDTPRPIVFRRAPPREITAKLQKPVRPRHESRESERAPYPTKTKRGRRIPRTASVSIDMTITIRYALPGDLLPVGTIVQVELTGYPPGIYSACELADAVQRAHHVLHDWFRAGPRVHNTPGSGVLTWEHPEW